MTVTAELGEIQKDIPDFGIEKVDMSDYPAIDAYKKKIVKRFNHMYKYERIKPETRERFIHELEEIFERIAPDYEYEFYMYGEVTNGTYDQINERSAEYKKVITHFCDEFQDNFF